MPPKAAWSRDQGGITGNLNHLCSILAADAPCLGGPKSHFRWKTPPEMTRNTQHRAGESNFPLPWVQRVGLPMHFHRQTYNSIGVSRTHPFPERHRTPYAISANGKVTKQILAKAIKNVKWKFPWECVPLYPTNSGWQLVTGTIWLPYVSRAERRNVYPCSFHHYNNMSKEPPLSRKARRNTKKIKNPKEKKKIPTTQHLASSLENTQRLKSRPESRARCPRSLATATAPRGLARTTGAGPPPPAAHSQ